MLKKKEIPASIESIIQGIPEEEPVKIKTEVKIKQPVKTEPRVKDELAKELIGILPRLDEEGLAFLIKQARVHLYNMKVDELNIAAEDAHKASVRSGKITNQKKAKKSDVFKFDSTGSGYYLRYQNNGAMFSKKEMVTLVKIVNGTGTDITGRLYNWFVNERSDVFRVIPIKDKNDNHLKTLAGLIKKNFNLKQKSL
ncbi:MAG: hypothetical protein FWC19_04790 [Treponema sp.]|nr:hypothetical protein [Treponema sp.]MCL2272106.1 hypothetical protein [Treponema sp.]